MSRSIKNGDGCRQRAGGVATVEWTYAAIYHLSLSTCVGGPAAGIIAICEQLTVIPLFLLVWKLIIPPLADRHVFRDDLLSFVLQLVLYIIMRLSQSCCWWSGEASRSKQLPSEKLSSNESLQMWTIWRAIQLLSWQRKHWCICFSLYTNVLYWGESRWPTKHTLNSEVILSPVAGLSSAWKLLLNVLSCWGSRF